MSDHNEEIDSGYIICPHCGDKDNDISEWQYTNEDWLPKDCRHCGKTFAVMATCTIDIHTTTDVEEVV